MDVYHSLLPDADYLYQIMKESEATSDGKYYLNKWEKWSAFGTYAQQKHSELEPCEFGDMYDKEKELSDRVYQSYYLAINDYIKRHNIALPDSARLMTSSFSKYNKNVSALKDGMTMPYHTDYIYPESEMPGDKFVITCTTYINDDYIGGEIEFYIDNELFTYKPKAGDILVFPSTKPYWHGVREITDGNKFFVRNFITYSYAGSDEWLRRQREFGAVRWANMERDRLTYDMQRAMIYLRDGKEISYDELFK